MQNWSVAVSERKESLALSNSQPIPAFSPPCNSQPDHSLADHRTCTSYYFLELSSISKYCRGSLLHEASTCGRQPIVSKPKCVIKLFPPSEYVFQNTHMHICMFNNMSIQNRLRRWSFFHNDGMVMFCFQGTIAIDGFPMVLPSLDHHH